MDDGQLDLFGPPAQGAANNLPPAVGSEAPDRRSQARDQDFSASATTRSQARDQGTCASSRRVRTGFAGPEPPQYRNIDPDTSSDAARSLNAELVNRRCAELLELIREEGCAGLTVAELVEATGYDRGNSARRITDLRELGWVVDSGRRRQGPSGRYGIVWVPTGCQAAA